MAAKGKITILHVDDNERTRYAVRSILDADYEVKAARLLGVSRPTLYRKMAEAGLTRPA